MSPQSFEYLAARDVGEALAALEEYGDTAAVLAGGQSLVPMINLRVARPDVIIDINPLAELGHLVIAADTLTIGAIVRHREFERPPVNDPLGSLLARAARHVGHPPIRTRGTFVGSIAHADPAAEWCLVALAVGADVVLSCATGERVVHADDFFDYPYTTVRRPQELITAVRLPLLGRGAGVAFCEESATAGSFAQAAASAIVTLEGTQIITARVAVGGVGGRPAILPDIHEVLVGAQLSGSALDEVRRRVLDTVAVTEDPVVPADYRRALAAELAAAAVRDAVRDAGAKWS